jgi:hypothetical protein
MSAAAVAGYEEQLRRDRMFCRGWSAHRAYKGFEIQ